MDTISLFEKKYKELNCRAYTILFKFSQSNI